MEPRHLKLLRRTAERVSDEAHMIECAAWAHFDRAAAQRGVKAAIAAEQRAWRAYKRAFDAQIAANEAALRRAA
jgi:hypothetical protein